MISMRDAKDVQKFVKEKNVSFIQFWFTDVLGKLKSFSVTPSELEEGLAEGMGFDGSSIEGFARIEESDMIALPDPKTFQLIPWRPSDRPVARMFCDIMNPDGTNYMGDPRYVLKRILAKIAKQGYTYYVGPELEFFYFANDSEAEILDQAGYFDGLPVDRGTDLRRQTIFALQSMGIRVEYSHHEVAPSQHEIDLRYTDGLSMADACMTYRITVKEVALRHGLYATFMPKPIFGENGSGMHTHQSLWNDGKPLFYDEKGYGGLSDIARWYIGGLLKHAPAVLAFTNPTLNSYRRLVPGFEAPVNLVYSAGNRSASIRIPITGTNPKAKRIEFRAPDASGNPYLAFAAQLMAGLDGIKNKIEPHEPVDKDLYELPPEEAKLIPQVPGSLAEALDALEADHEFLTEGNVFTQDLIDTWISYKRTAEITPMAQRPHPFEYELYFSV